MIPDRNMDLKKGMKSIKNGKYRGKYERGGVERDTR